MLLKSGGFASALKKVAFLKTKGAMHLHRALNPSEVSEILYVLYLIYLVYFL